MKIKTAAELQNRAAGQTASQHHAAAQEARQGHFDAMDTLNTRCESEGRDLRADEQREWTQHDNEMRRFDVLLAKIGASDDYRNEHEAYMKTQRTQLADSGGHVAYAKGQPLAKGQTFAGYARAQQLDDDIAPEDLSLRKALRGIALGDWNGAESIRNAMSGGSGGAGGYLIPAPLAGEIIDMARNEAAVLKAGARIIPMESRTLDVAKWTGDPAPAWHTEAGTITPTDGTLSKVTLTAHTLAGLTVVSRELLEDAAEVETELRKAFAAQFALTIDAGALYGSGTAPEIRGVKNTSGVTKTPLATNGATPANWDWLVDARGRLADVNESSTAVIYSPRTARTMAKIKDTTNQPLRMPDYLSDLETYVTNQIGNAYTVGTSSVTSDAFLGDWSQLYVGVRIQFNIQVLNERYADTGQIGFLTWWRGDVQVARPAAFDVTTGVLA